MNKVNIELENCYGIKKLTTGFDFSKGPTYSIYAPNGIMKTSFAKTFLDLSNGVDSQDAIFKNRVTKRQISDETGTALTSNQIFVIVPYSQDFKSKKISTLLVNKELKEKYEAIHISINEKKDALIKELKPLSGLKNGIEETISNDFTHTPKDFYKALTRIKAEILSKKQPEFTEITYQKLFNDKVTQFLETKDFKTKLEDYIDKYNQLIQSSTYFKKGIFNHNNAATIAKNLKDNGFFEANHGVVLNGSGDKIEIKSEAELEAVIQKEKESILSNLELKTAFDEIDSKIVGNKDLREFREYLEKNQAILPSLGNLSLLKQNLWISYLKENIDSYKALEEEYTKGFEEISKIEEQAKREATEWRGVINEFNRRFYVPFKLSVDNQEDVILKSELPNIKFIFEESGEQVAVEEKDLFKCLSGGELRALYILNIIFEVEARKHSGQETLFIVDDIADSFDYKNKYAIIQYLKDISTIANFKQIILTHNFDFHRTIASRLDLKREYKLNTVKTNKEVFLIEEKYQNNPFITWKKELNRNDAMLIASVPFFRNITEYTGDDINFLKLTSLLHCKPETNTLTISDLQAIIRKVAVDQAALVIPNGTRIIMDVIYDIANDIITNPTEIIELEYKVALAIAIRLKAEQYMIAKINDAAFIATITKNQTISLIKEFRLRFPAEIKAISILEQVNLMTPENIHLNSFMYEPILDMSNEHLKNLYTVVITELV